MPDTTDVELSVAKMQIIANNQVIGDLTAQVSQLQNTIRTDLRKFAVELVIRSRPELEAGPAISMATDVYNWLQSDLPLKA